MSKGQDYLTPWHRECIERGATLLVIPVEPQPGWGEPPQRSEDDRDTWFARGIWPLGNVVRLYAYCPFYSGIVVRVGDVRLRITDVACKRIEDMTLPALLCALGKQDDDMLRPDCVRRRLILQAADEVNRGIRQSHPEFLPDGYVWMVSVEREGE